MSNDGDRARPRSSDEDGFFPTEAPDQAAPGDPLQPGPAVELDRVELRRRQWREADRRRRARWANPPIGWLDPDAPPRGLGDNPGSGRRSTYVPPCPCECNSGGFCGGCGHAGCGGLRERRTR